MQTKTEQSNQTQTLTSAPQEDRSKLLNELVTTAIDAIHGVQRANDHQIGQVLSALVRTKLLSADDSYSLKDQLNDREAIDRALDFRIESALKRKGLLSEEALKALKDNSSSERRAS